MKRKQGKNEGLFFCDFIAEKEASGLSKQSIINYKKVYASYKAKTNRKISQSSISNWIHKMISKKMNPISINFYIAQMKVFVNWLIKNGYCDAFEINLIKTQEPQMKTLSDEEIAELKEIYATIEVAFNKYLTV